MEYIHCMEINNDCDECEECGAKPHTYNLSCKYCEESCEACHDE